MGQAKLTAYLNLTKPRIIVLLLIPTVVAMFLAAEDYPSFWLVLVTLFGGALAAGGANAINCYLDRDIDVVMYRTKPRAIPAGKVTPLQALIFGVSLGIVSVVLLGVLVNPLSAALALIALLYYVFIYTSYLKRSTPSNIVIGGLAGAIPPLIGWAAVTGELDLLPWWLFLIIFFWTPPHFWALSLLIKKQYEQAMVPMLPVVRGDEETRLHILLYSALLVALTAVLFSFRLMGLFYLAAALVLGGVFIYLAIRLYQEKTPAAAKSLFRYSIYYLALLFLAMVIDYRVFNSTVA